MHCVVTGPLCRTVVPDVVGSLVLLWLQLRQCLGLWFMTTVIVRPHCAPLVQCVVPGHLCRTVPPDVEGSSVLLWLWLRQVYDYGL